MQARPQDFRHAQGGQFENPGGASKSKYIFRFIYTYFSFISLKIGENVPKMNNFFDILDKKTGGNA